MKPLDRLLSDHHLAELGEAEALAFVERDSAGILLLPGDPSRPEVTDVAVVLGELAAMHPSLRLGVARAGEESTYREKLGVISFPALLFVRSGTVSARLLRMQSWHSYAKAARSIAEEP